MIYYLKHLGLSPSASLNVMLKQSDQVRFLTLVFFQTIIRCLELVPHLTCLSLQAPFVTPVALTPVQSSVPEQNSRLDTDEDETANQYPMPMEEVSGLTVLAIIE